MQTVSHKTFPFFSFWSCLACICFSNHGLIIWIKSFYEYVVFLPVNKRQIFLVNNDYEVSIWTWLSLCYIHALWTTNQYTGKVAIYELCICVILLNFVCPVLKYLSLICPLSLVWVFIIRNVDALPLTFPNYIMRKLEQCRLSSHSFFANVDFYYGIYMNIYN